MCTKTFKFDHFKYSKIDTLYKRGEKNLIMIGDYSNPLFPYLLHNKWLAYEKVDGTNMSYYWDGHNLEIHGKTEDAKIPPHLLKKMKEILPVELLKEKFPPKYDENGNEIPFMLIIYGEGYGQNIGKVGSRYLSNDVSFRVFDIVIGGWWLDWENVVDICNKLNLEHVVPYGEMTLAEAEELVKKMEKVGAKAYLVNTGWNGTGKRISIKDTRGIIDAILDGSINTAPTKTIPYFDFVVPTELPGVDPKILDPRDTYECACQWEEKAKDLAGRFIKNFAKFTGNEAGKALVAAGPKL